MNHSNYFKLLSYPQIKLEGFSHIYDTAYVRDIDYKKTLVVECKNSGKRKDRLIIHPTQDRIEQNESLYTLIRAYGLDQKEFVYDAIMEIYFPTHISVS